MCSFQFSEMMLLITVSFIIWCYTFFTNRMTWLNNLDENLHTQMKKCFQWNKIEILTKDFNDALNSFHLVDGEFICKEINKKKIDNCNKSKQKLFTYKFKKKTIQLFQSVKSRNMFTWRLWFIWLWTFKRLMYFIHYSW